MKKIVIVQSLPHWMRWLQEAIEEKLPELKDDITYTDSFDHTLDIIPKEGEIFVISSWMFHDKSSVHRTTTMSKVEDGKKDGDLLAKMIKEINPKAQVYIFSSILPTENFIDGYVLKLHDGKKDESIAEVIRLLKKLTQ